MAGARSCDRRSDDGRDPRPCPSCDPVRIANGGLNGIEAMMGRSSGSMIELLAPLLGGARVRVSSARAVRA